MSNPPSLAPEWMAWITENLLRGALAEDVIQTLVDQKMNPDLAHSTVTWLANSGILDGARKLVGRGAAMEQATRLRRSFERQHLLEVSALNTLSFFDHWTAHRPVVLRGAALDWPTWTLDDLDTRFGSVEIEVLKGRSAHKQWWQKRDLIGVRMPLSSLLQTMRTRQTDDIYGVGRNNLFDALPTLANEIGTLPGIAEIPSAHLWIGPQGTVTPLHHDQSSAWLVQRIGRKRAWLASPLEPALFDTTRGIFNSVDARNPMTGDLAEVHWWETVLQPGDALFLPAGWWHQVIAETASVSVSLGRFIWPNSYPWYAPMSGVASPIFDQ
ncbi:MAG: hypothetical protein GWP91_05385 [Rhodobacterales bacterium]|nr:hypothetical protein [Rhodobacterales bacterium]